MIVYFLRHASAGEKKATEALDRKRPLDREGILQSTIVGRCLASLETQVDAIISSPLKRATQTAALVANELGHEAKLRTDTALEPRAEFESFRALLQRNSRAEAIMVVGHNPNLSRFLSLMITDGANASAVTLKKGAVARVEASGRKPATLAWCFTPKLVRAAYDSSGASSRPKTSRK